MLGVQEGTSGLAATLFSSSRHMPLGIVTPVKKSRGGLVFKAHGLFYHAALGSRVIKKKTLRTGGAQVEECLADSTAGSGIMGGV